MWFPTNDEHEVNHLSECPTHPTDHGVYEYVIELELELTFNVHLFPRDDILGQNLMCSLNDILIQIWISIEQNHLLRAMRFFLCLGSLRQTASRHLIPPARHHPTTPDLVANKRKRKSAKQRHDLICPHIR